MEFPRFAEPKLVEALEDTPVVLIQGPRQCGKTTLARMVGRKRGYVYWNLDDTLTLQAATVDPVGFVDNLPGRVILDEVQRAPGIFTALKVAVDRRREAGRFLLTGSSNVLLLPKLADSLAGRMGLLRLHPLSQCELGGRDSGFLDRLLEGKFQPAQTERLGEALAHRVSAGGYPPAIARPVGKRQAAWYLDYVEALVQRDVRDMARIASLDILPRLLAFAAGQTAKLVNISDLAAPFQVSRPTIREYVTLLERVFLLDELPPWHTNRLSRLVKSAKLHIGDTGLACALLGLDGPTLWRDREMYGQMLETFVYLELRRQAGWHPDAIRFFHYRDKDNAEVDIVLEGSGGRLAGVEVKASATVEAKDFRGLRKLRDAAGKKFAAGVVV
ncbi:MAG: ATP-binding protein, partial [Gemmataceae bacterium]